MRLQWLDLLTQRWVRLTGRRVDLQHEPWLRGPVGDQDLIADTWLDREADRLRARVDRDAPDAGLLPSLAALDGPGFAADDLAAPVRDFYEHTSRWRLDLWLGWSPPAWPFAWLVSALFSRRLQQLALPLHPLDVSHGMTSAVTPLVAAEGQVGAVWLRRLRSTRSTVYSGYYGTARLPRRDRESIRVAFPLPNGRLIVLLHPTVSRAGGLELSSPAGRWGDPGAYLVVEDAARGTTFARRIPVHEHFHVYVDSEGVLRTDHRLALWRFPLLRLHYRITHS